MLLCEVIKGARPGAKYLTDHLLSLLVFGGAAAEFVLLPQFGTSTFFLLTLLALVDFLSGIALRRRRGARWRPRSRGGMRGKPRRPSPNPSSNRCPTPAPPAPARRSRAAGSLEPKIAQPEVTPHGALAGGAVPGLAAGRWFVTRRRTGRANSLRSQMICRVRMPATRACAGWRCRRSARRQPLPAAGCGFAGHARRLRAIGRQRSRRAARAAGGRPVHSVGCATGTSATQAGLASATPPSSTVCSGRPLSDIANRNPAELSHFGT